MVGFGGYRTHPLHAVQHEAFQGENAPRGASNRKSDVPPIDLCSIVQEDIDLQIAVDSAEDLFRESYTRENAIVFYEQVGSLSRIGWYGSEGRVIAVAHILSKRRSD